MTRDQKTSKAKQLRKRGMTLQAIAEELGYKTAKGAWALLNQERNRELEAEQNRKRHQRKLEWQSARDHSPEGRGRCSECGGPMGVGGARHHFKRCQNCIHAAHRQKCESLERLWLEGKTIPEIQRELGWTKGYVSRLIFTARREYRYRRST